jgi:adenylosuccinate synthase
MAAAYNVVARFNGGANAGHTVATASGAEILKLHQLPSGIARPKILNIIGNGALVDPLRLVDEIRDVKAAGLAVSPANVAISDLAHLILPHHIALDELRERGASGQGSTKRGIAFAARDKYERSGVRAELILYDRPALLAAAESGLQTIPVQADAPKGSIAQQAQAWVDTAAELAPYITDTVALLQASLKKGDAVLAEGAQAFGLDIEFGMYPFVTSSHTTSGGAVTGLGIDPHEIKRVIGVAKAIKSHVGGGPFVTEFEDAALAAKIRGKRGKIDGEYGASTGRERKVGYLDLPELRRAVAVNGVTEIALTKFDVLNLFGTSMRIAVAYDYQGKTLQQAPSAASQLAQCKPVYVEKQVWSEDISNVRQVADLPLAARQLLEFLTAELGVPITVIGVGPERDQVIFA